VNIYPQVSEIESRSYFNQGDIEVNFSTNIGVGFQSVESSNSTDYNPDYYQYGDRPFIFLISAAIGVCIIEGLTVEPELDINLITDAEVSTSILANFIYNFNIPRKKIYPFLKLGYGFSNYIPDYYYNSSNDNSLNTGVFNAGAGLKIVYSSGMAIKLEINYKQYNSTTSVNYYYYNEYTYEGETRVEDLSSLVGTLTLSLGYSILF